MAVGKNCRKIEGRNIILGKPMFTDDICPRKRLQVVALRSPHAFAKIIAVDKAEAENMPGVELIFDWREVPRVLHSIAAEAYPEGSPYDRYMLDEYVRYVGDPVAIVAAWTREQAEAAIQKIKVTYEIFEPVIDFTKSIDNPICIHEEVFTNFPVGSQPERNIATSLCKEWGNVEEVLAKCPYTIKASYLTTAQEHAVLETHRACSYFDENDRIVIVGSIHSPFHVQRIVAKVLGVKMNKLRVISARSGGSFGGKNSIFTEHFCAFVTMKTGYPAEMILSREECFEASTTRHAMKIDIQMGGDEEGYIRAIDLHAITNTGAYGEHAYDVVCVACNNTLPIFSKIKAVKFLGQAAYSNTVSAGAFRGFGGAQTSFALAAATSKLAAKMGRRIDEVDFKNIIRPGEVHPFLAGGTIEHPQELYSSTLDECIIRGKELIGWEEMYPYQRIAPHKVQAVGMSVAMHGSGIAGLDLVGVDIRFNQDGSYTLYTGVADLGTGGPTAVLQIAAEVLMTDLDNMHLLNADTELTPYDKGPYASSTVYITGHAAFLAAEKLRDKMIERAAVMFETTQEDIIFDGRSFAAKDGKHYVSLEDYGWKMVQFNGPHPMMETASYGSRTAPPPFVAGFAKIELDELTGEISVIDYAAVVDCGTVINPNFARIQVEGGVAQGIGYALYEDMVYDTKGKLLTNNYAKYRIPGVMDIPDIKVEFKESMEPTGPFGAKSLGEVVIHTPAGAIHNAIFNACGVMVNTLPMTPEKILHGIKEKRLEEMREAKPE